MADADFRIKNGLLVNTNLIYAKSGQVGINTVLPNANLAVNGTMSVNGAVSMTNTLSVTGSVTFSNQISFSGNGTFTKGISVTGASVFSNTVAVTGAVTLSNTLYVTGATTFANSIAFSGSGTVSGSLSVSGAVVLSNTLAVTGTSTFTANALFSGSANVVNQITVGSSILTGMNAVIATSNNGLAVLATSTSNTGVKGISESLYGIWGVSNTNYGAYGQSVSSYGVYGTSNSSSGVYGASIHGTGGTFISTNGPSLYAGNNTTEFFRVAASGYIGMGNTSPVAKLHVQGDIVATGDITAFYSDERLKTNINKITDALKKVKQISGVTYINNATARAHGYYNDEPQVGVLAGEIEKVLPEAVKLAPFDREIVDGEIKSKSGKNYKTVQYEKIIPLLIEAIKDLSDEVDSLK